MASETTTPTQTVDQQTQPFAGPPAAGTPNARPPTLTEALKNAAGTGGSSSGPQDEASDMPTPKRTVSKPRRVEKRVHMALDLLTVTVTIHVKGPGQEAIAADLEKRIAVCVRACFTGGAA